MLTGRGMDEAYVQNLLPLWLLQQFPAGPPDDDPSLAFGPSGESACAVRINGLSSYAWGSNDGKAINVVCGLRTLHDALIIQPVLNPILRDILLTREQFLLHAALVSSPVEEIGMLIIAPSGGGKTTTALSVVRNGGRLVADDLVSLHLKHSVTIGLGIPKILNLRSGTLGFFSELLGHADAKHRTTGECRTTISPTSVYGPDCLLPRQQVDVIYFPKVFERGPAIRRLCASEVLAGLILAHSFNRSQRTDATSVTPFIEMLSIVPAYELSTGLDPVALGHWLTWHASEIRANRSSSPKEDSIRSTVDLRTSLERTGEKSEHQNPSISQ